MDPLAILKLLAPQFAGLPNLADHLALAAEQTDLEYFGTDYHRAIALRAAHELTLQATADVGRGGAGGSITSEKEGDLSRSYALPVGGLAESELSQTSYGIRLFQLIRSKSLGVFNRRM